MSNIEERVIKMVAEQLGVKEEDVKTTSSFVEDLGADSLDTVELIMALEEEFDAEIPDEEAEKIATVQDAITYISANGWLSRIQKKVQEEHKRNPVKSYKWIFAIAKQEGTNTLVDDMKNALKNDPNSNWKISRDVYDKTTDFIVVHMSNQYPDQQFYLKLWGEIPNFDKTTNNFVLLSAQYEEIQRLKNWNPNQ